MRTLRIQGDAPQSQHLTDHFAAQDFVHHQLLTPQDASVMPDKMKSADAFRRQGHQMVDLIADYMENIESYPVQPQVEPGHIYRSLPDCPPAEAERFEAVLDDVHKLIIPNVMHWQSPNFFGYFPTHTTGPSILGDMLSSGLGIQGMLWATSPACTELETCVMDWMVDIAGLPRHFRSDKSGGGVIQDSASSATLCAIVAAREQALKRNPSDADGLNRLCAYISSHAHSSVDKGLKVAGIRPELVRRIDTDHTFAIRAGHLQSQVESDIANGLVPAFICATIGTTSSLAIDPVEEIGEIVKSHQAWLHVDSAHAGCATVCEEYRWLLNGLELANSYCFNPHKWLLTNFDCDLFYVADRNALVEALTITPEYLRNKASESGSVFDYSGWQIPLGRRFRSLKLWFVIRMFGTVGMQEHIRRHIELTQRFSSWVEADSGFEQFQPAILNLVCFRHRDGNEFTREVLRRFNASGRFFATHTVLNGTYVIRFVVGAVHTELHHVEAAWSEFQRIAQDVAADS